MTNVLLVTAEADPFAKVGGLADVAGSLPRALVRAGVDARVLMPGYGFIDSDRFQITSLFRFPLARTIGTTEVEVLTTQHNGVTFYFLRGAGYFGVEAQVYDILDWKNDVPRYLFFCQAALAFAEQMQAREGWFPDVFHVNDWHTGLIPFLIETRRDEPQWSAVGSMLTIHNMAYQGWDIGGWVWELGIPARADPELVARSLTDNALAIGIMYSDVITTVSPRYATEIQYPFMGYGLDPLILARIMDVHGILNGMDVELWNPETDPMLVANFSIETAAEKRILNKRQLQADSGLEVNDSIPLIGLVSRLVYQKGIDIALPALRRLLLEEDVQFVALGTGEPALNDLLLRLGQDFHWRAATFLGYNATVAQRIYAGVDLFLMPSRYEPCGVGQMIAMRYGALPLVRETGGLADTVENYDNDRGERGTGFSFLWEESDAVLNTLRWALQTYRQRPEAWRRMQQRAMQMDFSWDNSARQYIDHYSRIQTRRKGQLI